MAKTKTIKKESVEKVVLDPKGIFTIVGTGTIASLPFGSVHEVTGETAQILINSGRAKLA